MSSKSQHELVIFDWDGTLMDSAGKIVKSMQLAADSLGFEVLSDAAIKDIIGLGLPEAIHRLYPDHDADRREKIRAQYAHFFVNDRSIDSQPFENVEALLEELTQQGRVLAVATGKSRIGLNRVLGETGFTHFFNASRCADETLSKPDPLMVNQLLEELKLGADTAVMVGDTEYDLEMAVLAGVDSIGVTYGSHSRDRLERHNPLVCADTVLELKNLF